MGGGHKRVGGGGRRHWFLWKNEGVDSGESESSYFFMRFSIGFSLLFSVSPADHFIRSPGGEEESGAKVEKEIRESVCRV